MDAKAYCDTINNQLTGWKATIYDTILATRNLEGSSKEKIDPILENLNRIVADLNRQLAQLRNECPSDWSPQKETIDSKLEELKSAFEQLSEKMDLLPDSTAWV